ncbi:hypothetical protein ABZ565_13730 [Streptomyces sp. NPDC016469]|uniref:hypothetical protein n=1 Tax=Streptomyces sp. NPDC016469 TaxID=3157191 RepID=UPI0033D5FCE9
MAPLVVTGEVMWGAAVMGGLWDAEWHLVPLGPVRLYAPVYVHARALNQAVWREIGDFEVNERLEEHRSVFTDAARVRVPPPSALNRPPGVRGGPAGAAVEIGHVVGGDPGLQKAGVHGGDGLASGVGEGDDDTAGAFADDEPAFAHAGELVGDAGAVPAGRRGELALAQGPPALVQGGEDRQVRLGKARGLGGVRDHTGSDDLVGALEGGPEGDGIQCGLGRCLVRLGSPDVRC